jgi:hypothetical protein
MTYFRDLTELCVYGVTMGFGLSFILWAIGLPARLFRDILR